MERPESHPPRARARHAGADYAGELDFRAPLRESMTTFKLLQRLKVPACRVLYPEEGHWIPRGENRRRAGPGI